MSELSFCEPVWATPLSRVHIRIVEGERKLGGGINTAPLCGFDLARGWDLAGDVTPERITRSLGSATNPTCPKCARAALALLEEA